MSRPDPEDLSNFSMLDLFRVEAESQTEVLTSGLLELERGPGSPQLLENLMRAAHSLKGAARIINLQVAVRLAHAMEDCFVAAQRSTLALNQPQIDLLLRGLDLLSDVSKSKEEALPEWEASHAQAIEDFLAGVSALLPEKPAPASESFAELTPGVEGTTIPEPPPPPASSDEMTLEEGPQASAVETPAKAETPERVLRLGAENLNRLLGLAGESLVESRWLRPFSMGLQRLKLQQGDLARRIEDLRRACEKENPGSAIESRVKDVSQKLTDCEFYLNARLEDLDLFDRRSSHLSHRLYLEVLRTRMRPFGDGVQRFPRMIRDLARSLGKQCRLEIVGSNVPVDRDILDRLETPLAHLLRNAVDHGCETPDQRARAGKPAEAVIQLEAKHRAGLLVVSVIDDGQGVAPESLRKAIIRKRLTTPGVAGRLSEAELLEFLFLPGFTLKESVTDISGRGVGLDVVQNMVRGVRGGVRVFAQPGKGMRFQLQLPLTLSVLRTLLVEVAGEPYAIPLTQINRTVRLSRDKVEALEGRHHFNSGGRQIGLLSAHQVLECGEMKAPSHDLPVVVLGDRNQEFGLVVDKFLGQRELVVQPLDPRLGKVKDISAAALMEDGSPVLIVDVEDMVRSIEKLLAGGFLAKSHGDSFEVVPRKTKRILAVDDSLTVRELVRKLLSSRGYHADVAVDGMDGWNALRSEPYDMVITDVDMPRMNGIELTSLIKRDSKLKSLPVMIVSYKDRDEDRLKGLEAGADYYLTKGSFHDETLIQAVVDLIGEPET
jgi:two-component system sensor histidine kinase and response regulator WspE